MLAWWSSTKHRPPLRHIGGSECNLCSRCLHQCLDHRFRKAWCAAAFHGEKMDEWKTVYPSNFPTILAGRLQTAAQVQLGATPTAPTTQVGFTCSTNVTKSYKNHSTHGLRLGVSTLKRNAPVLNLVQVYFDAFEVTSMDPRFLENSKLKSPSSEEAFAKPSMSAIPGVLGVEARLTHLKLGGDFHHGSTC